MTPKKLERDLRNFVDLLTQHDIAIASNPLAVNRLDQAVRVTWNSPLAGPGIGQFGTLENYRSMLELQAYTAVLLDGAILQISFDFDGTTLKGHRLCYYPCPFEIDPTDLVVVPILDIIDMYCEAGMDKILLRSPIRFDYDPKNAADGHPAVHVHIIRAKCRCPIVALLSLGHFISFVFSHFYPDLWKAHQFLRAWPMYMWSRTISVAEEGQLHFACRRA